MVLSPPTNEVRLRVALVEAKASQRCCLRHSMPAGAASRYALGAGGVGAVRPAPTASLISASRYALGARRTALRAEGAARLCAGRRSRWLPSPPRATRSAPMAWGRGRCNRALVLVLRTNIAVLLDCSKSSRQRSLPSYLLLWGSIDYRIRNRATQLVRGGLRSGERAPRAPIPFRGSGKARPRGTGG